MFSCSPRRLLLLLLPVLILPAACSRSSPAGARQGGSPPVPVVAATVEKKAVPLQLPAIGNVKSMATVSVKPRVSGQIAKVHFLEGQDVKAGELLVSIDPAPFEVALQKAQAQLAQAKTEAEVAVKQAERYTALVERGAVAVEQVDQLQSMADAARSRQAAAEAAVKEAELLLGYCTVRSPIDGRTGSRMMDAGNVVKEDETELVVINQLQPIQVVFAVPEQHYADISRYRAKGQLAVSIQTGAGSQPILGVLSFMDNAIKPATGTLEVKATMQNEDLSLWPGQFGEVKLTLTTDPDAIVVPATAVQTGQAGQYVFVIKDDLTVEIRPVKLQRTSGLEAVIQSGLKPGEQVVVEGQLRLAPGSKVEIKPAVGLPQSNSGSIAKTVGDALP